MTRTQKRAIEFRCLPLLWDTHSPSRALHAIIKSTGYRPAVDKHGRVMIIDGDGDEVTLTPEKWIAVGRKRIRYMIKAEHLFKAEGA